MPVRLRVAVPSGVLFAAAVLACAAHLEGVEGPPETEAGPGTEAGDDALVSETSPPDAASDAPFCERTDASYCEDFDRETDLTKLIFAETSDAGLALRLTGDTFRSPPRSLLIGLPKGSPEGSYAVYRKGFGGERTVRVELDWNVYGAAELGSTQTLTLRRAGPQVSISRVCAGDPVTCGFAVYRCINGFSPCDSIHEWKDPTFVEKWARIFVEVRFTANGRLAFGYVDGGAPIFEGELPMYRSTDDQSAPTVLTLGVAASQGASPGVTIWHDNVLVTER